MSVEIVVTISVLAGIAFVAVIVEALTLLLTRQEERRAIRRRLGLLPGKGAQK